MSLPSPCLAARLAVLGAPGDGAEAALGQKLLLARRRAAPSNPWDEDPPHPTDPLRGWSARTVRRTIMTGDPPRGLRRSLERLQALEGDGRHASRAALPLPVEGCHALTTMHGEIGIHVGGSFRRHDAMPHPAPPSPLNKTSGTESRTPVMQQTTRTFGRRMPAKVETRIGLLENSLVGPAEPPPGDKGILQGHFVRGKAAFVPPAEQRPHLKTRTFRTKARDDIPMRLGDLLEANGAVRARVDVAAMQKSGPAFQADPRWTWRRAAQTCSVSGARRTCGGRSQSGAGASDDSPMEDGAGGRRAAPRSVREHDR
jgi:hypothetical protein